MPSILDLPPEGAPRKEWERVVEALNGVQMTMDQVERGYDAYLGGDREAGGYDDKKREEALLAFCTAEGLAPAPAAALAILLRAEVVISALSNGYDRAAEDPEGHEAIATAPFTLYRNYDYEIAVGKVTVIDTVDPDDPDEEPDPDQFDFFPELAG